MNAPAPFDPNDAAARAAMLADGKLAPDAAFLGSSRAYIEIPLGAAPGPSPLRDGLVWLVMVRDARGVTELAVEEATSKIVRTRKG